VYINGHRIFTRRGKRLRAVRVPSLAGTHAHHVRIVEYVGHRRVRTVRMTIKGCRRAR
jgi:hypothetical protein